LAITVYLIPHQRRVPVTIIGGPKAAEVKMLPKHKKNPEVGQKRTVYSSDILIEQDDALSFDDQEEVLPLLLPDLIYLRCLRSH
jgi:glutamyl-tRNA synthetase